MSAPYSSIADDLIEAYEPQARSVTLRNEGSILDTYLKVRLIQDHLDPEQWNVLGVEVYYDAACTRLLYDDVVFAELPKSDQDAIYAALDAKRHEARQHAHARRQELLRVVGVPA